MSENHEQFIERVAIEVHLKDADECTVKWAKQPGKYRASVRRDVRDVINALERLGFAVVKASQARAEVQS